MQERIQAATRALKEGRHAQAQALCLEILSQHPQALPAWIIAGLSAAAQQDNATAEALFRRAVPLESPPGTATLQLARLLMATGRWSEAVPLLGRLCVPVPRDAASITIHLHYAEALRRSGQMEEAAGVLSRLLQQQPSLVQGWYLLGKIRESQERNEEAIRCWEKVVQVDPVHLLATLEMVRLRGRQNQTEAARQCLEQGIQRFRKHKAPLGMLKLERLLLIPMAFESVASQERWRRQYVQGLQELEETSGWNETCVQILKTPFYAHYTCEDERENQERLGRVVQQMVETVYPAVRRPLPPPPRRERIRVGFASSHLHTHTITRLFRGWIEGLDRARFEVGLYPLGTVDAMTAVLQAQVERYRPLSGNLMADVEMLRAEQLDVLIYPEVGMRGAILALSSVRCAPVQAVTWGHPVTTGLPNMDVFLSSAAMEPPGAQAHYRERLVCLPGLSLYLQPPQLPAVSKGRREFGLPETGFLMLCSQSLFKLLPANDWVYVRLLRELPQAHLVLISGDGQPVFEKRLQKALGPMAERVIFLPEMNHTDFLDLNRCADLFLDGLAWSGGQTTLEAVACGLLPVTAPGPYMRMRHTAAILEELGLPELIAPDLEGLLQRVFRIAREPEWADTLRSRLQKNLPRLYQDARVLRALEAWMVEVCRG